MTGQPQGPSIKQFGQVAVATVLVAGCPVAVVWWLRASETVSSVPLALGLGMALSLLASYLGQVLWEKRPGSEDLLFNELMIWGYIHRLRSQRRLANAAHLIGPIGERQTAEGRRAREQARLLERLVAGMETRDPYLHGHSRRVARHSWMIAKRMGLPREEVARVRTAAAIHDVGKTKTPKTILHKPGQLTDEEYRIIKLHPGEGALMARVLHDEKLVSMIRHHHERLDGSGYPDGLFGESIPLGARIIAVADTFDAITSARAYRAASPHKKAIDILHEEAGARLDPEVVKAFRGHYAGRGPLALWSFVAGLPERLITWLSSSVATVASAAKVVAVAALVGSAAATSSTLGLSEGHAKSKRTLPSPTTAVAAAGRAHLVSVKSLLGHSQAHAPASARKGHHGSATHTHQGGVGNAGSKALAPEPQLGQEAAGGAQSASPGEGSHERAPEKETSSRGKVEEAPGKTEEPTGKGKSEENAGKGKSEESPSSGQSEESPGKGKSGEGAVKAGGEEATGKSKSEVH